MKRHCLVLTSATLFLVLVMGPAVAAPLRFTAGAPGLNDPYFPMAGNGGYDVRSYDLAFRYDPNSDELRGVATISARATQNLSRFNLDLDGLTILSITVNQKTARFSRAGGELSVVPSAGLRNGRLFTTVVKYGGIPETLSDGSGFIHTDDGALVAGEPSVAATWFPVNDHPSDKASYTFHITVPDGLKAIANGVPFGRTSHAGWTTWNWKAVEPMASYLATATIGEFDVNSYTADGIQYVDAIDSDLIAPVANPRTGEQFASSQPASSAYKRLTRTVTGGGMLEFWVDRGEQTPEYDFVLVEARTPGGEDWTTLPDLNGHTSTSTGHACPDWLALHPFLAHYQSPDCTPTGTTGGWNAASGDSDGYEQWSVDLSAYPDGVEVSISQVSSDVAWSSIYIDDITITAGPGTTSFESDADVLDGWQAPGPPEGSPAPENNWSVVGVDDLPPSVGAVAAGSFARQPEILEFLGGVFGPYPFSAAGGIVDDHPLGFALENQTRPIYSPVFFVDSFGGDSVVVHELTHQWIGNSLAVAAWQHIWLNESFATYAEWLWAEQEGRGTAQEAFEGTYGIPADDPFWSLRIGDPGPEDLFAFPVYVRGAMTLHALRTLIGDEDFFRLLPAWAELHEGKNVTTDQFVALTEQVSGQQLDGFFQAWLFTGAKPGLPAGTTGTSPGESSGGGG